MNQTPPSLKFPTFMKHFRFKSYLGKTKILNLYIFPECRNRGKEDIAVLQENDVAEKAIKWRTNRAFTRSTCPQCQAPFNRAHIHRCSLLNPMNKELSELYEHDIEYLQDNGVICNEKLYEKYTVLDSALNHQRYHAFLNYFTILWLLLYHPP
jgi:hypothetical protein